MTSPLRLALAITYTYLRAHPFLGPGTDVPPVPPGRACFSTCLDVGDKLPHCRLYGWWGAVHWWGRTVTHTSIGEVRAATTSNKLGSAWEKRKTRIHSREEGRRERVNLKKHVMLACHISKKHPCDWCGPAVHYLTSLGPIWNAGMQNKRMKKT